MGKLEEFGRKRYLREGNDKPVPEGGIRRWGFLIGNHFGKLVWVNLLFVAFSLPVVTLPAALSALNRVCIKLVREGNCFVWDTFFGEFKASFKKSLPLGALFGGLLAAGYYLVSLALSNSGSIYGVLFGALGALALLIAAVPGGYAFVLLAMLALPNRTLLHNAFVLSGLEGKRALMILGVQVFSYAVAILLFPTSAVLLLFCWPALTQLSLCAIINVPVQERIIAPFEAGKEEHEAH